MTGEPLPQIPLSHPAFAREELEALSAVLASGWVTQGARVAEFENRIAARVGARHAVAVSSGTAGLHLALLAAGVGPGDEVIIPTHTFIACANAVVHAGARPVLADVDARTFNLRVCDAEARRTPRTRAVMCVHQIGLPCDLDELSAWARDNNLALVEDAACALGATYRGMPIGSPVGSAVVFSFHPRKILTTGEGGMITTNDAAAAERLRRLRQHGLAEGGRTPAGGSASLDRFVEVGWNYRMSDLHAAVGLVQLDRLDELLARRFEQAQRYNAAFAASSRLLPPRVPTDRTHTYQSYQLLLAAGAPERDAVLARVNGRGIAARQAVGLCHRHVPYADQAAGGFANAEEIERRGLLLPLYHQLTRAAQDRVIAAVLEAVV